MRDSMKKSYIQLLEESLQDKKRQQALQESIAAVTTKALNVYEHYKQRRVSLQMLRDVFFIGIETFFTAIRHPVILTIGWRVMRGNKQERNDFVLDAFFNTTVIRLLVSAFASKAMQDKLQTATGLNLNTTVLNVLKEIVSSIRADEVREVFGNAQSDGSVNPFLAKFFGMLDKNVMKELDDVNNHEALSNFLISLGKTGLIEGFDGNVAELVAGVIKQGKTKPLLSAMHTYFSAPVTSSKAKMLEMNQVLFNILKDADLANYLKQEGMAASLVKFLQINQVFEIKDEFEPSLIKLFLHFDLQQIASDLLAFTEADLALLNADQKNPTDLAAKRADALLTFNKNLLQQLASMEMAWLHKNPEGLEAFLKGMVAKGMIPGANENFAELLSYVLLSEQSGDLIKKVGAFLNAEPEGLAQKQEELLQTLFQLLLESNLNTLLKVEGMAEGIVKFLHHNQILVMDEATANFMIMALKTAELNGVFKALLAYTATIDAENRPKTPQQKQQELAALLYSIKDVISDPNFSQTLGALNGEEVRKGLLSWVKTLSPIGQLIEKNKVPDEIILVLFETLGSDTSLYGNIIEDVHILMAPNGQDVPEEQEIFFDAEEQEIFFDAEEKVTTIERRLLNNIVTLLKHLGGKGLEKQITQFVVATLTNSDDMSALYQRYGTILPLNALVEIITKHPEGLVELFDIYKNTAGRHEQSMQGSLVGRLTGMLNNSVATSYEVLANPSIRNITYILLSDITQNIVNSVAEQARYFDNAQQRVDPVVQQALNQMQRRQGTGNHLGKSLGEPSRDFTDLFRAQLNDMYGKSEMSQEEYTRLSSQMLRGTHHQFLDLQDYLIEYGNFGMLTLERGCNIENCYLTLADFSQTNTTSGMMEISNSTLYQVNLANITAPKLHISGSKLNQVEMQALNVEEVVIENCKIMHSELNYLPGSAKRIVFRNVEFIESDLGLKNGRELAGVAITFEGCTFDSVSRSSVDNSLLKPAISQYREAEVSQAANGLLAIIGRRFAMNPLIRFAASAGGFYIAGGTDLKPSIEASCVLSMPHDLHLQVGQVGQVGLHS
jgi:hypothetical protein